MSVYLGSGGQNDLVVLVVMEFLLVQSCNRLYTSGKLKQKMFSIAGVSLFSNVLWCSEVFVYINNVCKHMPIFFIYISNYSVTSVKIPVQKWQIGCLIESIAEATKWVKMAWCRNICKKKFISGWSIAEYIKRITKLLPVEHLLMDEWA